MAESPYLMTDGMTPATVGDGFVLLPPDDPTPPAVTASDTDTRIATIESLARTAQEQATATRAETQRLHEQWAQERTASQQQQDRMTTLIETLAQRLAQPAPPTTPTLQFGDIIEEVALNPGKKDLANQFFSNAIAQMRQELSTVGVTPVPRTPQPVNPTADANRPMTVSEFEARTSNARLQSQLVNDFAARHSALLGDESARTALLQRYGTLKQDPLMQAMFPADTTGVTQIDLMGQRWDLRLLDRAASDVTQAVAAQRGQRQQQGQHGQEFPTQGGGPTTGRPVGTPEQQYIPKGTVDLLKLPQMHQALASLFGTTDQRSLAKEVLARSPKRQDWQQQAALNQPTGGRR